MQDFLRQHVIQTIWCSPPQDHQYLFNPMRITKEEGVKNYTSVQWSTHTMPTPKEIYHIYQIGQLSPILLNAVTDNNQWISFQSLCNTHSVNLFAYLRNGIVLPRFQCYIKRTENRNILIAVKDNSLYGNITEGPLFVRFYSNAFFNSERQVLGNYRLKTEGFVVKERSVLVDLIRRAQAIEDEGIGGIQRFHNGWLVNRFISTNINEGDCVEYVHDTSIKQVIDYPIGECQTFVSALDGRRKYLLVRPGETQHFEMIDYQDDIQPWFLRTEGTGYEGLVYHKATDYAVRMVTHKDYSIPVQSAVDITLHHPHWNNSQELTMRFYIRHSGFERPLQYDHQRIYELIQLNDQATVQALVGPHSLVPEWQAGALENSAYTEIMRMPEAKDITPEKIQNALGYHGIAYIIANTPYEPTQHNGKRAVYLNWRHRFDTTLFEYDTQGRLIDFVYFNNDSPWYYLRNENAGFVEAIVGLGTHENTSSYNSTCEIVNPRHDYVGYVSTMDNGLVVGDWREAVYGTEYVIHENEWIWLIDLEDNKTIFRCYQRFLLYDIPISFEDGVLFHRIEGFDDSIDGQDWTPPLLPFGRLDLFLNGHSLIENLDYRVNWPNVVICNKEYLNLDQSEQRLTVRAYGFLTDTLERLPQGEVDFIRHGLISLNERYNVREGIVMRMVVNGRIYPSGALKFSESDWGATIDGIRNGAPYQLNEVIVPLEELQGVTPYEFRERSLEVDQRVEDYLTQYHPEPEPETIEIIERRYMIFSPFLSRIHHALLTEELDASDLPDLYTDTLVEQWVDPYLWLLEYDPLIKPTKWNYVSVHPHERMDETAFSEKQYLFFKRVISRYITHQIPLSTHLRISKENLQ